jgi:hypothetical protein
MVAAQAMGRVVVVAKLWVRHNGGGHGLIVGGMGGAVVQTRRLMGGHQRFHFFNLSETSSTLKIKMGSLSYSKNFQFFLVGSIGYYEQYSQLCHHQIPNRNRVKNPGPDSTFESLKNFKRDLNLPEKSGKFSKILS